MPRNAMLDHATVAGIGRMPLGFPSSNRHTSPGRPPGPTARVGAVQYLNTKPLVHGLAGPGIALEYDLPSRLADQLAAGSLDVALIPSIEFFRGDAYRLVSDACIGCHGPVMSVKVFFRKRPDRIDTLAVDEGSRTSIALARILLAHRCGVAPQIDVLPLEDDISATTADAVLLIGDRAIGGQRGNFETVWDLGEEWCRWTGLPFVFAVWAARRDVPEATIRRLEPLLNAARDTGRANFASIAAAEAKGHGLTVPQCLGYLRDNLHYDLGLRERAALALFYDRAAALSLAPKGIDLARALALPGAPMSHLPGSSPLRIPRP